MIKIDKDFLNKEQFNELKNIITSDSFPWFYQYKMTKTKNNNEKSYFSHIFYKDYSPNSSFYYITENCLKHLNVKSLIGIRANLNLILDKKYFSNWHTDQNFKCKTSLFYINDNNGYTEIKDDNDKIIKINCKENTMITFDSYHSHRLVSQTNTEKRIAINFNYF